MSEDRYTEHLVAGVFYGVLVGIVISAVIGAVITSHNNWVSQRDKFELGCKANNGVAIHGLGDKWLCIKQAAIEE